MGGALMKGEAIMDSVADVGAGPTRKAGKAPAPHRTRKTAIAQNVLVFQGGGALGAYQAGVYHALSEGGIEPDWVIGTSIGAINGAIIAGNAPKNRLARLREFWDRLTVHPFDQPWSPAFFAGLFTNASSVLHGVPNFYEANPHVSWGLNATVGIERAAFYATEPLRRTLTDLVDCDYLNGRNIRLTVGAVSVRDAEMHYFDSRDMPLSVGHIMASGAIPPAFPAVRIDGETYWDGGLYSNTPVEAVLDDKPRRNSLIFSVNMWQPRAEEPGSIWEVLNRQKDIQFASRAQSHVARQEQLHRLRHIIRELEERLPPEQREDPAVRELLSYGCATTMHLVLLLLPRATDGQSKDIDFTRAGVRERWQTGYEHARRVLASKPWEREVGALEGVVVHDATQ
jgi:NTE family protein